MSKKNDQDLTVLVESRGWANRRIVTNTIAAGVVATVAVPLMFIIGFGKWVTIPRVILLMIVVALLSNIAVKISQLVYQAKLLVRELVRLGNQSR